MAVELKTCIHHPKSIKPKCVFSNWLFQFSKFCSQFSAVCLQFSNWNTLYHFYRKGACENCGAMTHKKRDCLERPRKVGAKFSGSNFAPDERLMPNLSLTFDGKRDRWNGYDNFAHQEVFDEFKKLEEVRTKKLREIEIRFFFWVLFLLFLVSFVLCVRCRICNHYCWKSTHLFFPFFVKEPVLPTI